MPIKTKFKKWLEDELYSPLVIESGRSTNTLLIKIAKNDNFDYLYQQTYYHSSHIERDEHLVFGGMYCKKDRQVYCAYNHLKQVVPEYEWGPGKFEMSEEMTKKVCQMINESVNSNPDIYSTRRPITEESEKYMNRYNEHIAPNLARRNFLAGNHSSEIEYNCRYEFKGWTEENLLEYILEPQVFMDNELEGYLSAHIEDILVDLRENECLKEYLQEIEEMEDCPLLRIKNIISAVKSSEAKTVKVTILKDDKDFSFKVSADVFYSDPNPSYTRWNIAASDRYHYEELFGRADFRPEEITEISYRGKAIYTAEPYEPVQTEGLKQLM